MKGTVVLWPRDSHIGPPLRSLHSQPASSLFSATSAFDIYYEIDATRHKLGPVSSQDVTGLSSVSFTTDASAEAQLDATIFGRHATKSLDTPRGMYPTSYSSVYFGSYAGLAVAVGLDTAVFRVESLFSHPVTTTTGCTSNADGCKNSLLLLNLSTVSMPGRV
jgi:hypothetical protein